jgi:prepilin-type N-terminal cleavage/methylation domain-containing protein
MRRANAPTPAGRAGFTLIELLVVLSIIAVLIALSAAATVRFLGVQQTGNTRTLLSRLDSRLKNQMSIVVDQAQKDPIPASVTGATADQRRALFVQLRLKQAFPMTFQEALNPAPLPPLPSYQAYLQSLGYTTGTAAQAHDSAACLLLALQRGPSGGGVSADDLGTSVTRDFPTPNGQTIKALVDGWGNPLVFCRAPTTGEPGPAIVSSGADGKLGLDPLTLQTTNANDAKDNLYSTRLP